MNAVEKKYIQRQKLLELVEAILKRVEINEHDAKVIADTLVDADLKGIHSHGIIRLPIYIKRVRAKSVKTRPNVTETRLKENLVVFDADDGFGQPVSMRAVETVISAAKRSGIAAVGVKNSHHFGTAAYYSAHMAKQNMIGIVMSNTTPLMPAIGGSEAAVGNNPISFAVPADKYAPIVLDMATSVVAMGKVLQAEKENKPIPSHWGMDRKGNATTSAAAVLESGLYAPVGGPKGFGLAFIIDILSGILLNGAFGKEIRSIYKEVDKPNRCGHFFIAIDIESFMPISLFNQLIDSYIEQIKQGKKAHGVEEIYMPGELELKRELEYKETGIPLVSSVVDEIISLARSVGLNETISLS